MSFTSTSRAFIPPAGSVPKGDRGYTGCTVAKAFAVIGGLAGTLVGPPALATPADPSKPTISADASAAIGEMGKTLLAPQFSFKARTLRVYADANGQPLHIAHTTEVTMRRPDRLRVDVAGDDGEAELLYDGKTTVLFRPETNKYATIPSPNTIQGMLKAVMGQLGVDFPLADFITDAPDKSVLYGGTSGRVINTVTIDDVPCLHMVLDQAGLELELWVENNDRAVPRRLVITYHSLPDRPNFIAELSDWNFDVHPSDEEFVLHPPEGAEQVALRPAQTTAPPKQKGTKP